MRVAWVFVVGLMAACSSSGLSAGGDLSSSELGPGGGDGSSTDDASASTDAALDAGAPDMVIPIAYVEHTEYPVGSMPVGMTVADFDNQNGPDIAVTNMDNKIAVLLNGQVAGGVSGAFVVSHISTGAGPYA